MIDEIKAMIAAGDHAGALRRISAAARTESDSNRLLSLAKLLDQVPGEEFKAQGYLSKRIAVFSGYTTQFITQITRVMLAAHKIHAEFLESDYGLYEQAVYTRDPRFVEFKLDACYFCVGSEHLSGKPDLEAELRRWRGLWAQAHEAFGADIIQNTFEEPLHRVHGNFEVKWPGSQTQFIRRLNLELASGAPSYVHFNDTDHLASHFGRRHWRDERLFDVSKLPVGFPMLPAYARNLASVFAAIFGRTKKCLVLDLDNTLWGGVIGDDGVAKIQIGGDSGPGESHQRFQRYIRALKDRGIILAVCSKNEESIAKEAFTARPEMVIKLEDISCFVANWEPKSDNIARIAKQLNIGLDSMVFVDDNPAEREIVRREHPEVTVLEMPEQSSDYALALSSSGLFETIAITEDDLGRTEQYRANVQREELQAKTTDYSAFLAGLGMSAVIKPFDEHHFPRIAQLINKTNQFNVTTRRYSDSELLAAVQRPEAVTYYVRLDDKFGDNGLISVFMGFVDRSKTLDIDTWLMSCRVLKRGVEDFLFQNVVREAQRRGAARIRGTYLPTPKNAMVAGLFKDLGFALEERREDGSTRWIFDLSDPAQVSEALERPVWIRKAERELD
jgi:FkbH-like protein